jgi:transposase
MKRERTTYSREFRIKAVELSNERGALASVAQELNISRDNLKRWKKEYSQGKFNTDVTTRVKSQSELELIKLKKELQEIRLERDILKKAVSIFSKSDR